MANIVTSSQTSLTSDEYDKAKKYLENMVAACDSQKEMDTFTWKYCKQKLLADISVRVSATNDKKTLKDFATKLILERIAILKKKEEQAAKAVQELFASDDDDDGDDESSDDDDDDDQKSPENKKYKKTNRSKASKTANNKNKKATVSSLSSDGENSSSSSSSSSGDDSISSDSSDSSDSEESESEVDSDEDGSFTTRQTKHNSNITALPKVAAEVANLLDAFCSKAALRDTMKRIRCSKGRLGKITRPQIQAAYTLLRQLQDVVLGPEYERNEQIKILSRNFFEKVKFEDEKPSSNNDKNQHVSPSTNVVTNETIIDSLEKIQKYAERLQIMSMVEASYRIITGTKKKHENALDTNYIDTKYRVLPCQISFVNSGSGQWKQVEQAVKTTQASIHNDTKLVLNKLYSIERGSELSRFEPFKALPNRKLLWYPVRSKGALAGILSLGLRVIPPDAPTTGLLFGKGIRLYDCVSRAVRDTEYYIYPSATDEAPNNNSPTVTVTKDHSSNDSNKMVVEGEGELQQGNTSNDAGDGKVFLILCDVACGKQHEMRRSQYMQQAPPPYHSVKAIGQFHATANKPWSSTDMFAPELPIGPMYDSKEQVSTKLKFNEYIVYDKGQICMKYLVELEMKNPSKEMENTHETVDKSMMMDIDNDMETVNNNTNVPVVENINAVSNTSVNVSP
jgi:hypothetical protein